MIDFFKATATLIATTIFSLIATFCIAAAAGFWFKVAEFGFTSATKLLEMFL